MIFFLFEIFGGFEVFANQPTVHGGGISRGEGFWLRLLALVTGDMKHVSKSGA